MIRRGNAGDMEDVHGIPEKPSSFWGKVAIYYLVAHLAMIQPPTDNLYKFCAITGLIIIIIPTYFTYSQIDKLQLEIIDLETEANVLNVETEQLEKEASQYGNELQKKEKDLQNAQVDEGNPEKLIEVIESAKNLTDQNLADVFIKNVQEFKKRSIQVDGKKQKMDAKLNALKFYVSFTAFTFIIGTALAFFGFKKWHTMQKKLDQKPFDS